jgi:hypothetical protein
MSARSFRHKKRIKKENLNLFWFLSCGHALLLVSGYGVSQGHSDIVRAAS